MNLRPLRCAALFLSAIFLQSGCVFTGEALMPPDAPGMDAHASKPKELPADRTAELCQAAGEELEKQGLSSDAVVQFEKARRLDPKRGQAVARRLAVLYDRLGDDAHALAEYKEALAAAPHDADLLNDFGYYHYQRGELADAEKCFRQALEANHSHLRAAVNLGLTLGKQGKSDASLEAFRQVLPASEAYCNVGVLLAQQGKAGDARHSLEEALHLEPGMKQARLVLDHLDDIAAAAPTTASRRAAVVAAPPEPPVLQASAPVIPPTPTRRETAVALKPPQPQIVAAVPPAMPLRQASAPAAPRPAAVQETLAPIALPPPLHHEPIIRVSLPPLPQETRVPTVTPAVAPLLPAPTVTIQSVQAEPDEPN